jgi:hypothetical protein
MEKTFSWISQQFEDRRAGKPTPAGHSDFTAAE